MDIKTLETTDINDFSLKWRWIDPDYLLMPVEDLNKIVPLSADSASMVFEETLHLLKGSDIENKGERISAEQVDGCRYLDRIKGEKRILVNWDSDCSVITTAEVFIKYWKNFCYPISDDVTIWPESKAWLLHYFHDEVFSFVRL
jgi:hypothetical protein